VRIVGGIYVNCLCNSDTFYWYMFSLDRPKKPCEPWEEKKKLIIKLWIFFVKNQCECMMHAILANLPVDFEKGLRNPTRPCKRIHLKRISKNSQITYFSKNTIHFFVVCLSLSIFCSQFVIFRLLWIGRISIIIKSKSF